MKFENDPEIPNSPYSQRIIVCDDISVYSRLKATTDLA